MGERVADILSAQVVQEGECGGGLCVQSHNFNRPSDDGMAVEDLYIRDVSSDL